MIKCDYCGKEIDRKAFCTKSHKVMWHKTFGKSVREVRKIEKSVATQRPNEPYSGEEPRLIASIPTLCQHGTPKDLCRYQSCRGT